MKTLRVQHKGKNKHLTDNLKQVGYRHIELNLET